MSSHNSIKKALENRLNQIEHSVNLLVDETRDWQEIKLFLKSRSNISPLTENQQKKLERYQYIYNQLMSGRYSENEVINQCKNIFEISLTQVYNDLRCTKEIFVDVININKAFELKLELASARALKRKSEEIGDLKSAAAFQKNIVAIIKEVKEIEPENEAELFTGHTYEMTFDPSILGVPKVNMKEVLAAINEKRKTKIDIDLFEDISFEEVDND